MKTITEENKERKPQSLRSRQRVIDHITIQNLLGVEKARQEDLYREKRSTRGLMVKGWKGTKKKQSRRTVNRSPRGNKTARDQLMRTKHRRVRRREAEDSNRCMDNHWLKSRRSLVANLEAKSKGGQRQVRFTTEV